jgi:hypothetical protein
MIPAYGVVAYNGYTFPATYQLKLVSEPTYSTINKSNLAFYTHTLTVTFIISSPDLISNTNAANSVDSEMNLIRLALQEPRKPLSFTYQGAGFVTEITSGTGAVTDDINGGPLPQINSWEPIGTNAAARVNWTVVFYSNRCMTRESTVDGLIYFEYDSGFSINDEGMSEIRQTCSYLMEYNIVNGDPNIVDGSGYDQLENLVGLKTIEGFRTTKQQTDISENGRKITYTRIQTEEPSNNALFPYTIKVSGEHTVESSLNPDSKMKGAGFFSWDNTITATIKIAPGYPPSLAWQIFLWIFYQRFYQVDLADKNANGSGSKNEKYNLKKIKPRNILTRIRVRESLYTREHSFEAGYLGTYKLEQLLAQSGLFTPIYTKPDKDGKKPWDDDYKPDQRGEWALWQTTVDSKVIVPYGYRKIKIGDKRGELVFDPCIDNSSAFIPGITQSPFNFNPSFPDSTNAPGEGRTTTPFETGDENFLKYQNEFFLVEQSRNYPIGIQDYDLGIQDHKKTTVSEIQGTSGLNSSFSKSAVFNNKTITPNAVPRAVSGVAGGSFYILRMKGYAIRQGFWTPSPSVVSFGGRQVERVGNPIYANKQLTEGAAPLYVSKWLIDYLVPFEATGDMFEGMVGNFNIGDQFEPSAT